MTARPVVVAGLGSGELEAEIVECGERLVRAADVPVVRVELAEVAQEEQDEQVEALPLMSRVGVGSSGA